MADTRHKLKEEAARFAEEGRLEEAVAAFSEVLSIDPHDLTAHMRCGHILRELGRHDKAVDCYLTAAHVYSEHGLLLKAISACKLVLELQPAHGDAQSLLAELHVENAVRIASSAPRPATSQPSPLPPPAPPRPTNADRAAAEPETAAPHEPLSELPVLTENAKAQAYPAPSPADSELPKTQMLSTRRVTSGTAEPVDNSSKAPSHPAPSARARIAQETTAHRRKKASGSGKRAKPRPAIKKTMSSAAHQPSPARRSTIAKRQLLEALTRDALVQLAQTFEISAQGRATKASLVKSLTESRRVRPNDVLSACTTVVLQDLAKRLGTPARPRTKAHLIDVILRTRPESKPATRSRERPQRSTIGSRRHPVKKKKCF